MCAFVLSACRVVLGRACEERGEGGGCRRDWLRENVVRGGCDER